MKAKFILLVALTFAVSCDGDDDDKPQINLYQRKREEVDATGQYVNFHIGFDQEIYLNSRSLPFKIDLNYDGVLVGKSVKCEQLGSCTLQNKGETVKGDYHGKSISYQIGKTFVNFYALSPAEIESDDVAKLLPVSEVRFIANESEDVGNVIGLAPNSKLWKDWNSQFYFRNEIFNITYSNYPDQKFIRYYSSVPEDTVLVDTPKSSSQYKFDAIIKLPDDEKHGNVCLNLVDDGVVSVNEDIYNRLLGFICSDKSKCTSKENLSPNVHSDLFSLILEDSRNKSNRFKATVKSWHLFHIDQADRIVLHFKKIGSAEQSGCDVVLQSEFFSGYYLLISNDLKNAKSIHVGLREIRESDFIFLNLWKYLLFVILGIFCTIAFLSLGSYLNSRRKKENELEVYDNLSQLESFKKKPILNS